MVTTPQEVRSTVECRSNTGFLQQMRKHLHYTFIIVNGRMQIYVTVVTRPHNETLATYLILASGWREYMHLFSSPKMLRKCLLRLSVLRVFVL